MTQITGSPAGAPATFAAFDPHATRAECVREWRENEPFRIAKWLILSPLLTHSSRPLRGLRVERGASVKSAQSAADLWTTRSALLLAALVLTASAEGATRYDPALRFRSLTTRHFVIHFHQGEETMARRLAVVAEEVHAELTVRMGGVPRRRTHVILVDQTDEPNGWATPVPYDLIEISAVPPTGVSTIGNVTDWLRLVFTHEYAHVLHLGRSLGWARVPRRIFGRVPFAFPNLSLPLWQIEGLATFEESVAGEGRVHAEDFHAIVTEAARAGRFEPLDRLSGGLVDWPDGDGWYAYGAFFHAYLAERFGPATLRELSDRTAGRVPYVTAGAFEKVFGRSLQDLWRDFRSAQEPTSSGTPYPVVERLTFRAQRDGAAVRDRYGHRLFTSRSARAADADAVVAGRWLDTVDVSHRR
jgi:hypothetical protein